LGGFYHFSYLTVAERKKKLQVKRMLKKMDELFPVERFHESLVGRTVLVCSSVYRSDVVRARLWREEKSD
jgi:hypothetical protein